jgi:hypothetical protein
VLAATVAHLDRSTQRAGEEPAMGGGDDRGGTVEDERLHDRGREVGPHILRVHDDARGELAQASRRLVADDHLEQRSGCHPGGAYRAGRHLDERRCSSLRRRATDTVRLVLQPDLVGEAAQLRLDDLGVDGRELTGEVELAGEVIARRVQRRGRRRVAAPAEDVVRSIRPVLHQPASVVEQRPLGEPSNERLLVLEEEVEPSSGGVAEDEVDVVDRQPPVEHGRARVRHPAEQPSSRARRRSCCAPRWQRGVSRPSASDALSDPSADQAPRCSHSRSASPTATTSRDCNRWSSTTDSCSSADASEAASNASRPSIAAPNAPTTSTDDMPPS